MFPWDFPIDRLAHHFDVSKNCDKIKPSGLTKLFRVSLSVTGLFVFHIFQAALALTIKGDPTYCVPTVEALRNLIGSSQIPVFGICLGHQILALATGAKTIKLK